jgi:ABC-2 type transport system permease protein
MTDRALKAHTAAEVRLTARNGESLLLTLGIPVLLLVFFSLVDVLPTETPDPVDFLAPGVLALAVLSTAMVNLAIATGFQRSYLVLKRLGATPLGRPRLLAAKTAAVGVVLVVQLVLLTAVGLALGWRPAGGPSAAAAVVLAIVLATAGFCGIGMLLAGTLRAEVTLAAANGLYLLLLLLGGVAIPLAKLPGWLQAISNGLPITALSEVLHGATAGARVAARPWLVLAAWAVLTPMAAARWFRWE